MSRIRTIARRTMIRTGIGIGIGLAVLLVLGLAFFTLIRPPIEPFEPVAWQPGPGFEIAPDRVDADTVHDIDVLIDEEFDGPEDVAVDAEGRAYASVRGGLIVRIDPETETSEVFADVGGRPLGLAFDDRQRLIIANHGIGLQAVTPDGDVIMLTDTSDDGEPIRMANDLAIGDDGVIYFSDSNSVYNRSSLGERDSFARYDYLDGRSLGRLLAYDPEATQTAVLLSDLHFPNGIVVAEDQRSLLVAESTRHRITRYWLAGERAGTSEAFVDDVPGVLDGMTADDDGNLLLPMYERVGLLDRYILPGTWGRQLVIRLPDSLGGGAPSGSILVLSPAGEVVRQIDGIDPTPSNIVPYEDGWLLGSLATTPLRTIPHTW